MNKTIGIIIAIIVVLVALFFVFRGGNDSQDSQTESNSTQTEQRETVSGPKSLKAAMAEYNNQTCTFTDAESGSRGTVYISSGRMRGDFTSTVNGQAQGSHMIASGTEANVWMDGQTTGFKMNLDAATQAEVNQNQQGFDPDKPVDMDCDDWNPDSSKFNLPSGVEFKDFSAMLEGSAGMMTSPEMGIDANPADIKAMQAKACEALPEPSKTQCLSALGQ